MADSNNGCGDDDDDELCNMSQCSLSVATLSYMCTLCRTVEALKRRSVAYRGSCKGSDPPGTAGGSTIRHPERHITTHTHIYMIDEFCSVLMFYSDFKMTTRVYEKKKRQKLF